MKIGLALGSGSSRGWSHIGVIKSLEKSRMAGDPPDILLSPKLSQIGLLDFHRAKEAIAEGEACVKRAASEFEYFLDIK